VRILTVDDDPMFRELLSLTLHEMAHEDVTSASSGEQALEYIARAGRPFDCFLLDIQMPGMSGVDVCRAIRKLEIYRQTPIIMITSMSGKSFVDAAFMAGATDYLTKPLDRLEIRARLGMAVRLNAEMNRNATLAAQASANARTPAVRVDFEAPTNIPGVPNCIEYLALENYLLTLGYGRQIGLAAFAVHIENAASIFRQAEPAEFLDMLKDVASVIADELKTEQPMIAYAGEGNFVALVSRLSEHDTAELETSINVALMDFESFYAAGGLPAPVVTVGELVRSSMVALGKQVTILDKAIAVALTPQSNKSRVWRFVS